PDRRERRRRGLDRPRQGEERQGRVRLERADVELRGPGGLGRDRSDQGRAHGAAERVVGRRAPPHHRGARGGEAEEGSVRRGWARARPRDVKEQQRTENREQRTGIRTEFGIPFSVPIPILCSLFCSYGPPNVTTAPTYNTCRV